MTHLSVYPSPLNCIPEISQYILSTDTSSYATTYSKFLDDFESFLIVAAVSPHNFLITGDFNIHVNKLTDANRIRFYSVLDAFNFMQLVSVPTHKDHNTLDLVIVPSDSTLVTDLTVLPVAPSDYFPILSYLKPITTSRQRQYY